MQSQKSIFIIIILILVAVVGFVILGNDKDDSAESRTITVGEDQAEIQAVTEEKMEDDEMNKEAEMLDEMSDNEAVDHSSSDEMSAESEVGKYLTYNPEAVANSEAENIVLSFSATWCPSCRTLDKDINESLSDIPAGTEIYKVDYDTNVALRQKYGVTTQHTQVVIDKEGNLIKKWTGSNTLEQFVAQI